MKKLLSMVVIFCMVFILGACGSKEAGSEANGNTEDEKAKIKIEELNYQVNVEVMMKYKRTLNLMKRMLMS